MRSWLPWSLLFALGCAPTLFRDDDDTGDDDTGDDDTGDDDTGGDDDDATPPPWDDDDWPDDDDVSDDDDVTTTSCGDWLATPLGSLTTDLPAELQGMWLDGQLQYAWGMGELRLVLEDATYSFATNEGWIWSGWDGAVRLYAEVEGDSFVFAARVDGWTTLFALKDRELPAAVQDEWGLSVEPLFDAECPWLEDSCVWQPLPLRVSATASTGVAWTLDVAAGVPTWSPDGLYYIEPRASRESLDVDCMPHSWGVTLTTPAWDG